MPSDAERARALRDRIEQDYPDAWDFKELTELVGIIESYALVGTVRGDRVVVTIVEPSSDSPEAPAPKRWAVWLSQKALLGRFQSLKPRVGDLVAIRYLGQSDTARPGESPAHRFRVEVDAEGRSFDWGQIAGGDVVDRDTGVVTRREHEAAVDAAAARGRGPDDDIPF